MSSVRFFRILSFGDSLTEGWYMHGARFYPYTKKLLQILQAKHPMTTFHIDNMGISGECVKQSMEKRLPEILETHTPYNLVIIQGGTNDLSEVFQNNEDPQIFEALVNLHEIAHKSCARTVAVTIPEAAYDEYPFTIHVKTARADINKKLFSFSQERKDKVIFCDLNKELPMFALGPEERACLWDDDLHFSPAGYDKMAEIIYESIKHLFS